MTKEVDDYQLPTEIPEGFICRKDSRGWLYWMIIGNKGHKGLVQVDWKKPHGPFVGYLNPPGGGRFLERAHRDDPYVLARGLYNRFKREGWIA